MGLGIYNERTYHGHERYDHTDPNRKGADARADGSPSEHYCKWCYQEGDFTAKDVDMDEFIEATAQMEADAMGISREEAVSLMATLLPHLDRWKNEAKN